MEPHDTQPRPNANRRLAARLAVVALAMFGFGFALVPLYDVFCQVTGLNGKTGGAVQTAGGNIDASRWVTVEFNGDVMPGLPWRFEPRQNKIRVHPGERVTAWFTVKNVADRPLIGRAVPSVTPPVAATHFRKIECFCFSQQRLAAGEQKEMPVTFVVARELPAEVGVLTLSYAFFPNVKTVLAQGDGKT